MKMWAPFSRSEMVHPCIQHASIQCNFGEVNMNEIENTNNTSNQNGGMGGEGSVSSVLETRAISEVPCDFPLQKPKDELEPELEFEPLVESSRFELLLKHRVIVSQSSGFRPREALCDILFVFCVLLFVVMLSQGGPLYSCLALLLCVQLILSVPFPDVYFTSGSER